MTGARSAERAPAAGLDGNYRYGRGSTLITSQLPVDTWHAVIDEPTFADAILDRLVHNAYRLALTGPSLRNPEATAAERPPEHLAGMVVHQHHVRAGARPRVVRHASQACPDPVEGT